MKFDGTIAVISLVIAIVALMAGLGYVLGVKHSPVSNKQVQVAEYVCSEHEGWSTVQNSIGHTEIICEDDTLYELLQNKSGEYYVNTSVIVTVDDPVNVIMNPNQPEPEKLRGVSDNVYKQPLQKLLEQKQQKEQKPEPVVKKAPVQKPEPVVEVPVQKPEPVVEKAPVQKPKPVVKKTEPKPEPEKLRTLNLRENTVKDIIFN